MELYANLTHEQREKLQQFPAFISLLAANADGQLDDQEKQKAIDLAHIKDYDNKEPLLARYYQDVRENFAQQLDRLDALLPRDKKQREEAIKYQLTEIETILGVLGSAYAQAMRRSMQSFKEYVSNAHDHVLEHFLFPLPIKGITQ
ncbi:hypothetical protein [Flavobacterium caeni]|uniref:Uncharacterized protein n=1 Tax=Flavobacterium caeni TaxID=490189 RepID=A0A1G5FS04_9FLAO|nr:hypothetical protein [Flavobacterium caeni]SCY41378.1 hypothetical protein SAMN02927903_01368 [Flavobacterium caeni]